MGGAASRAVEIDYDRRRGAYKGSSAQAMDEIWSAGVQNAVQSLGEGIGEGAAERSRFAGNMQRRHTDAFIVSDSDDGPVTINRRPAANDNSDPAARQLWNDFDGPRKANAPNDPVTKKSAEAEEALKSPRKTPTQTAPAAEADDIRHPTADNDNDAALAPAKIAEDDGNVTSKLPLEGAETDPMFLAKSSITDEAEGVAISKKGADDDGDRVMATFDPEKTGEFPADIAEQARRPDLLEEYQEQQKLPPRKLEAHIDSYDGQIGRPIHDTVDLSDRDLTRLGHMPKNSRITASDPKSLDAAMHNYKMLMAHDRNREVMLIRNKDTGEYLVVQGGPTSVTVPKGPWIVERHSHPKIIDADLNDVLVRSIPSGKPGDVGTVMAEVSDLLASAPAGTIISRRSVIDIQISDQKGNITTHQTTFGVIGDGPDRIIWVEYRNPKNGNAVELHAFRSLADYEAHVLKTTGVDLTKQGENAVRTPAPAAKTSPPPPLHSAALSAKQRADIDFIAGRMAMRDDFDRQVQGLRTRGEIDPHLGRAASLEDAQARVRQMGLVGEPDSDDPAV